jgi:hypothetical protein
LKLAIRRFHFRGAGLATGCFPTLLFALFHDDGIRARVRRQPAAAKMQPVQRETAQGKDDQDYADCD